MIKLNAIRNKAIDFATSGLTKLKAKPPTIGTEIRDIIDAAELSPEDTVRVLNFLQDQLKEKADA